VQSFVVFSAYCWWLAAAYVYTAYMYTASEFVQL